MTNDSLPFCAVHQEFLHTIVGRTIVFSALMIVPNGKAYGIVRARKEPRERLRASSKGRPRDPLPIAGRACCPIRLSPHVHRATGAG